MPAITIDNLCFSYGSLKNQNLPVLKGINLTFEPGLFYAITGPNGSGKTTLLNLINSSLRPASGHVLIDGKDVAYYSQPELARNMALVPQNTTIDFDFTVKEIVLMGRYPYLRRFQQESQWDIDICDEAMKSTGIYNLRDKYINQISGGERQRAIVARALAQQTPVLLLDEPISMLDIHYQISLMNTVRQIMKKRTVTVIAVLHDLNIASRYADRVILMNEGRVFSSGTPRKVYTPSNLKNVYNIDLLVSNDDGTDEIYIKPVLNKELF